MLYRRASTPGLEGATGQAVEGGQAVDGVPSTRSELEHQRDEAAIEGEELRLPLPLLASPSRTMPAHRLQNHAARTVYGIGSTQLRCSLAWMGVRRQPPTPLAPLRLSNIGTRSPSQQACPSPSEITEIASSGEMVSAMQELCLLSVLLCLASPLYRPFTSRATGRPARAANAVSPRRRRLG